MGFWQKIFTKQTPAEKLHEKLQKFMAESNDGAMIPEVREAITQGKFVDIELTSGNADIG